MTHDVRRRRNGLRVRFSTFSVLLFAAAIVTANVVRTGGDEATGESAFTRPVPAGTEDLRAIQDSAVAVTRKVLPCTVGIQLGRAQASGVIVSSDGYILTAAHVVGRPGLTNVRVKLSNGRTVMGRTLGMNPDVDGGLIKITQSGDWPFAEIVPRDEAPKKGDWCLAIGHPGGYQAGRSAPVRLGRVIRADEYVIRTDCPIQGGDSGGPLFDMQGRVIGIHSRIAESLTVNLHVPAATYQDTWEELKRGRVTRHAPPSRFLALFDTNGDGSIVRTEIPNGPFLDAFDRIAKDFELDSSKPLKIADLRKQLGLSVKPPPVFDPSNPHPGPNGFLGEVISRDNALDRGRYIRGRSVRGVFRDVSQNWRQSIVRIEVDDDPVVLGTIVGADGWVVSKASSLANARVEAEFDGGSEFVCHLANGRRHTATLVATDTQHDVALLRVDARGLPPIAWSDQSTPDIGSWVITAGQKAEPLSVGVVSVPSRSISRSPGVLGITIDDEPGGGAVVTKIFDDSGADRAGLKVQDVVTQAGNRRIYNLRELQSAIRQYRVGDAVDLTVRRGQDERTLTVVLGMFRDAFFEGDDQLAGPLSRRRDDFPKVIQHDSIMRPHECGGPVVDLAGRVIGINIARADRTASYILPGETVVSIVDRLRPAEIDQSDKSGETSVQ